MTVNGKVAAAGAGAEAPLDEGTTVDDGEITGEVSPEEEEHIKNILFRSKILSR
jgi:hypothetical protein